MRRLHLFCLFLCVGVGFIMNTSAKSKTAFSLPSRSGDMPQNQTSRRFLRGEWENSKKLIIPLQNYRNQLYYADLFFGVNSKRMSLVFDTGSSHFWVKDSRCAHCEGNGNAYDCFKSNTCKIWTTGGLLPIQYSDGAWLSGDTFSEIIRFNRDATAKGVNHTGIAALSMGDLNEFSKDGVVGLGNATDASAPPFILALKSQGLIDTAVFAIKLGNHSESEGIIDSNITFGWYDYRYNKYLFRVNSSNDSWTIKLNRTFVGSFEIQGESTALISSGTAPLLIPKGLATIFNLAFNNSLARENSCEFNKRADRSVHCRCMDRAGFPTLAFELPNRKEKFELSPDDYLYCTDYGCFLLIEESGDDKWVFGQVFLRKYYTVFDAEKGEIGFAPILLPHMSPQPPQSSSLPKNWLTLVIIIGGAAVFVMICLCLLIHYIKRWRARRLQRESFQKRTASVDMPLMSGRSTELLEEGH